MKKRCAAVVAAAMICTATFGSGTMHVSAEEFKESGTIWVIGDSISSDHGDEDNLTQNERPITGWGNVLQNYLGDKATIQNKARSGRSSRSYTMEPVYKEVNKGVKAGDYVMIQFGHNDENESVKLHTDPTGDSNTEGSFKWYLKTYYIEPNIEAGAKTILCSNVTRYVFEDGKLGESTNAPYAKAMKELAEEYSGQDENVYFIDTYQITRDLYEKLGADGAERLHAMIGLGDAAELDTTHYGPYGAMYMGNVLAKELKALGLECCQDIRSAKAADADAAKAAKSGKFSWR